MHKRFFALLGLVVALGAGPSFAHSPTTGGDCDTWSRTSGGEGGTGHGTPSHHDISSNDIENLNDIVFAAPSTPLPIYIHRETGHYVVRDNTGANMSYVEVVGGGVYTSDGRIPKAGEGGYVQGRLSAGGQNEVDYHVNFFGPIREGSVPLWWTTAGQLCVSVGTTKVDTGIIKVDCLPQSGQCHRGTGRIVGAGP